MIKRTLTLILSCFFSTAYASGINNVYLNNKKCDCLFMHNGEIMIKVRPFFESAGFAVQWFGEENRVTAFNSSLNITMIPNEEYVYVNKTGHLLEISPTIIDGTFVMPVSAVVLSLDATANYNNGGLYISTENAVNSDGWEYKILDFVNEKRTENGLNPVIWNEELAKAGKSHCEDMIARGYFSHNTPEGLTPFDRVKKLGTSYRAVAENIAAGQPDPESVMASWMKSNGHRKNILNPGLTEMGAAFAFGGEYGIYWAQEFATF